MYLTFRGAGWLGLLLLFGAVITGTLAICYWRSAGKPFIAGLSTFMAGLASAPLFGMRPQMFTLLFASIFVAILSSNFKKNVSSNLWSLPLAMLLWVNLHAGFALGIALIVMFIAMNALEKRWSQIKPLAITLAACVMVIPINPHGFRMFSYPLQTLSSPAMQSLIQEWLSPDFHQFRFLPLAILMLATYAVLALSPQRITKGELMGLLILSLAALRSGRHIPLFSIFAAPIFAEHFAAWVESTGRFELRRQRLNAVRVMVNLALLLLPGIVIARQLIDFKHHEATYESSRYPVAAVDAIKDQQLAGPIFNDYNWGGYLIWKLYPERRVFIDGRADVYSDDFLFDYVSTLNGKPSWRKQFERFGIQTVLIEPRSSLATLLRQDKDWRTVFEDAGSVVFARN